MIAPRKGSSPFVKIYSAFRPIFAILLSTTTLKYKRTPTPHEQLDDLYNPNAGQKLVNMAAIIATAVGAAMDFAKLTSFSHSQIPARLSITLMKNMVFRSELPGERETTLE